MRLFRWEAFKSDCSVTCGEGNRTIKYECVQRNMRNNEHSKVVDQSNCPQKYETTAFEVCMQPCNEVIWVYSDWGTVGAYIIINATVFLIQLIYHNEYSVHSPVAVENKIVPQCAYLIPYIADQ